MIGLELCGVLGSLLFATACVPMAWKTIKKGGDIGNPVSTMWTFVLATFFFSVYLIGAVGWNVPSVCLVLEWVCWTVALYYHYFPRRCAHCEDVCARMAEKMTMAAKAKWDKDGPCAPQCLAECEGYCAAVSERRAVGKAPELAMGYQGDKKPQKYHNTGDWSGNP